MKKKIFASIGTISAITLPVAALVACNDDGPDLKASADTMLKAFSKETLSSEDANAIRTFYVDGWTKATNDGAKPNSSIKSKDTDAYIKGFFYELIKNSISKIISENITEEFKTKFQTLTSDKAKAGKAVKTLQDVIKVENANFKEAFTTFSSIKDDIDKYGDFNGKDFGEWKNEIFTEDSDYNLENINKFLVEFGKINYDYILDSYIGEFIKIKINTNNSKPKDAPTLLATMLSRIADHIGDNKKTPAKVGLSATDDFELIKIYFKKLSNAIGKSGSTTGATINITNK